MLPEELFSYPGLMATILHCSPVTTCRETSPRSLINVILSLSFLFEPVLLISFTRSSLCSQERTEMSFLFPPQSNMSKWLCHVLTWPKSPPEIVADISTTFIQPDGVWPTKIQKLITLMRKNFFIQYFYYFKINNPKTQAVFHTLNVKSQVRTFNLLINHSTVTLHKIFLYSVQNTYF